MDADEQLWRRRLLALLKAMREEQPIAESLELCVSQEVSWWMAARDVNYRTLKVNSSKLYRCLNADNVTLQSVAAVANSLGCEAVIVFVPRRRSIPVYGSTPLLRDEP